MPWRSRILLGLAAMMTPGGALTLLGCARSDTVQRATASAVPHPVFLLPRGAVFHPALVNLPTTCALTTRAAHCTLASASGTATGPHRFGSGLLTGVARTSPAGAGPHVHDVIPWRPCDFDSDNTTRKVSQRSITATSAPGTAALMPKGACGMAEVEP
jgi:hypothetical protein